MVNVEDILRQIIIYGLGYVIVEAIEILEFEFHKYQDKKASKEFYRQLDKYLDYRKPAETNRELREHIKTEI